MLEKFLLPFLIMSFNMIIKNSRQFSKSGFKIEATLTQKKAIYLLLDHYNDFIF